VSRGLQLIEGGALDDFSVAEMAETLGVGDRHLRRLFVEHLGTSPLAVAQSRRVHFAKRLIEETRLPMTQIAFASGYRNVRRFNAEVQRVFNRSPRDIRKLMRSQNKSDDGGFITLRQSYRAPFDWDGFLAFLAPRAIPGVETVSDRVYRRTIDEIDFTGVIEVTNSPRWGENVLLVRVPVAAASYLARLSSRVRRLFDLGADPNTIADQLSNDPLMKRAIRGRPGLRVPGAWNRFETAVRAILGQQISVSGATQLTGKLVQSFGRPIDQAAENTPKTQKDRKFRVEAQGVSPRYLFPHPEDLVDVDIASIGMPKARAESIRALARAVRDGQPVLEPAPSLKIAVERLTQLPGIGDWTAQYIAMRALGEPDAFPAGDLGLRKALAQAGKLPAPSALRKRAEAWRPWRAYAVMWLWDSLAAPSRKDK
jgi:AraC family transcriptional regulator of adaptative response / DNA-3-methyladenine glycosylase II